MESRYPGWRSFDRLPAELIANGTWHSYPRVAKAWCGLISPLADSQDPARVLAALAQDRAVDLGIDGTLNVLASDAPEQMVSLCDPHVVHAKFAFRVTYREPPAHPSPMLTYPEIDPACPHKYSDGSACALLPSDGVWDWHRPSTMADYLDYVSIWAAKYAYWKATNAWGHGGLWIGAEAPHNQAFRDQTANTAQCWCGSGLRFGDCHGRGKAVNSNWRAKE